MSKAFSRRKEKRPRSTSSGTNKSFVKSVTSRVTSLLPNAITKWFSSPSSSNTNGSARVADNTDSSTEDEAPDSPVTPQPPAKRTRFFSPRKYNYYLVREARSTPSPTPTPTPPPTPRASESRDPPFATHRVIQRTPGRNTFSQDPIPVSTPLHSPEEESAIEISDSESTTYKTEHNMSAMGRSLAYKRKSLFHPHYVGESIYDTLNIGEQYVDTNKPYFNADALVEAFFNNHKAYGGTAMTSIYLNRANTKLRRNASVNNSAKETDITTTSRQILDLLENYPSPLAEGRRIPQYGIPPKNKSLTASTENTLNASLHDNKPMSYKTQELYVPSIASILTLKKNSRLMDTTNAARQIIASHSSSTGYSPYPTNPSPSSTQKEQPETDSGSNLTTKVKSRLTRTNRGGDSTIDEVAIPVQLPTAVLEIEQANLPKFTFSGSSPSKTSTSTSFFSIVPPVSTVTSSAPIISVSEASVMTEPEPSLSKPDDTSSNMFKFSSPVRVLCEPSANHTPPKYAFDSPERGVDKPVVGNKEVDTSIVVGTIKATENKAEAISKEWKCPECWISNKTDEEKCVCCGFKKVSPSGDKPVKCSMCKLEDKQAESDICVNCDKIKAINAVIVSVPQVSDSSKWKCEDCWISNDPTVEKCVCCGNVNPKRVNIDAPAQTGTDSIVSDWKCDDCWIMNKGSVEKCAACGSVKPGSKISNVPTTATAFGSDKTKDTFFSNITKSQNADTWECSSCLVKNDKTKSICACCGADIQNIKAAALSTFNFGMNTNTTFKFGINHAAHEDSSDKMMEDISPIVSAKMDESETNNNVLSETPTFTFGLGSKKPEEMVDFIKQKSLEPPTNMNFKFGISKLTPTASVFVNKSPEPPKVSEAIAQELPQVSFGIPAPEPQKQLTGFFTAVQPHTSMPTATIPSLMGSPFTAEKKESFPVNQLTLQLSQPNATSAEASNLPTAFTFSARPNINMFGGPTTTTTAATINFGVPSQTTLAPTTVSPMTLFQMPETATSMSLFPKSDMNSTSAMSMFQKSDVCSTSAPPPAAVPAPVFGFGSNASIPAPQNDKPKFNFSFGSAINKPETAFGSNNKTESSMFKPFGMLGDSTGEPKGFSMPSGNTLSLGNTGPLGGTNGPMSVSPMVGNILGATELTNPLTRGSGLQMGGISTGMFGQPAQTDNMWPTPNNNNNNSNIAPNPFVSNGSTNTMQKPAAFTFGSPSPFNANNSATTFGNAPQPAQNMFQMASPSGGNQQSMFSTPVQSQQPNIFGNATPNANPAPPMSMFGTPNVGAAPAFGMPNASIQSFETPSMAPAPAPAFNFGAHQSTGVFGFGQQPQLQQQQMQQQQQQQQQMQQLQQMQHQHQQQQQPQQPGVYNFGVAPGASPQVQFNMGSAPNTTMRRVRKAVRRNPQR